MCAADSQGTSKVNAVKPGVWLRQSSDDADAADHGLLPAQPNGQTFRPDILETIEKTIDSMSSELRTLSLDIHGTF
jgi:hypothetical protein